jgi:hypothetical protein
MSTNNIRYNSQEPRKMKEYRSLAYYPYPEPKNIYRINPLCLNSLNRLDIDDLQDAFGKNIQDTRSIEEGKALMREIIIKESPEIKEIKDAIEHAKMNQVIARQMNQNLILRKEKLLKEAEEDELVLKELENEKKGKKKKKKRKKKNY